MSRGSKMFVAFLMITIGVGAVPALRGRGLQQAGACTKASGCANTAHCCSQWGFCGSGADYCNAHSLCGPGTPSGACGGATTPTPTPAPTPTSAPAQELVCSNAYLVKSGDSLWAISQAHGTTVADIQTANTLGSNTHIVPGQMLKIPPCNAPNAQMSALNSHLVTQCLVTVGTLLLNGATAIREKDVIGGIGVARHFAGTLLQGRCNLAQNIGMPPNHPPQHMLRTICSSRSTYEAELALVTTEMRIVENIKSDLASTDPFNTRSYSYQLLVKGDRHTARELLLSFHTELEPIRRRWIREQSWCQTAQFRHQYLYLASTHLAVYRELMTFQNVCLPAIEHHQRMINELYYPWFGVLDKCMRDPLTPTHIGSDGRPACWSLIRSAGIRDEVETGFDRLVAFKLPRARSATC